MDLIQKAVTKHFPQHDLTLKGYLPLNSIPLFLNSVFHQLGYNTINVDQQQAHQIFEIIDQDNDKVVTKHEIIRGLMRILNSNRNLEKPQTTWSTITQVPTSSIKRPETQIQELQLNYLFQKYDVNRSGFLDKGEIVGFINQYLKVLGRSHQFSSSQSAILMGWLDKDHDKKVSKQQIWKMYNSHLIGYL